MRQTTDALFAALATALLLSTTAQAQEAGDARGETHAVELRAGASNLSTTGGVGWRFVAPQRLTLTAGFDAGAVRYDTIGGYAIEAGQVVRGRLGARVDVAQSGPATLGVNAGLVVGGLLADDGAAVPDERALLAGAELGALAQLRLRGTGQLDVGFVVPVEFELRPSFTTHRVGAVTTLEGTWAVGEHVRLGAGGHAGGVFGSDGDGQKADYGGQMLLRWYPTGGARADRAGRATPGSERRVGGYVGVDWRVFGLAGHVSHGPGVQAGLLLANGHLKVGLVAFGRPGPMNPATFELALPDGQTYRGASTLSLRSDGAFVGLGVAPVIYLGAFAPLSIEIPIAVGQSAFGFYLVDDDRETPDGRRPSAWEDELQDGRDSSFALGLDVGVDVAFHLRRASWVQPYVGVRRHQVFGYDAFLESDYSGFAGVAGVQFGTF